VELSNAPDVNSTDTPRHIATGHMHASNAEAHIILISAKKPRDTPAKCALCNGDHPANYKGCKYYHSLLKPNNADKRLNIHQQTISTNAPSRIESKTTRHHQQYYHQNLQCNQQNTSYADVVRKGLNHTANEETNILTKFLEEFKSMFNQIIQQNSMVLNMLTTLIGKIY
jgi:hypothetical protein